MARFTQQLKTLIQRNILLKKRTKKQLIQEIFFPVYFILILAMVKALVKPKTSPAIDGFPVNSLSNNSKFQFELNKTVLVTPNTPEVQTVMADVHSMLGIEYKFYPDIASTEAEYKINSSQIGAGLVFSYLSDNMMSYAIRMNYNDMSSRDKFTQALSTSDCRDDPTGMRGGKQCKVNNYLTTGFIWLQNAVETALVRHNLSSTTLDMPDVSVQLMPKDRYTPNISVIQTLSSIYFVFAYSFFINFLTTNIVAEKEKKIREGMKMMGLMDTAFWLSWGLVYAVIIFIVTIILIIITYATSFFENSNMFILFVLLYLYGLSIINFSFMLSPFFKKAKVAGTIASFATVIISTLYFIVSLTRTVTPDGYSYSISVAGRYALCLLSPVALALGLDQGIYLDIAKNGMSFDNINLGEFPLFGPIIMLIVDIVLYGILAFYFDRVIPGEYGVRYKPWYCLMPSYWRNRKNRSEVTALLDNMHIQHHENMKQDDDVESVPSDIKDKAALRLFNITKTFTNSDKEEINVVDGISLEMFEGQITGLLGHNGAGKTTLINMLCGLLPPTSGSAIINNLDVSDTRDMEKIRAVAGICPQHNILFEDLSCREHLQVFAGIKGVPENLINSEIEKSLKEVDLSDQGDVFSKELSGGQKRKLSVAIALIGDPKIIILDEPTAGMDPYSRRHLWSLLKSRKEGKVILLTTHFMDEADILADRKAIISKGKLRCCGSSLFLKSRFGIGYHLNMVVEPGTDYDAITSLLEKNANGVEFKRSHAKELAYTIPLCEVDKFSGMFTALEEKDGSGKTTAESLGIMSYGVSMTSLEEVFLKLGSIEESDRKDVKKLQNGVSDVTQVAVSMSSDKMDINSLSKSNLNLNTDKNLLSQRIKAMLKIRFLLIIRSKLGLLFQIFIPIILVVAAVVLNKTTEKTDTSQPVPFQLTPMYSRSHQSPACCPNFLMLDPLNTTESQDVINQLEKTIYVDDIKNSSADIMSIAPHWIGVTLQSYVATSTMNYTSLYNDTALHSLPVIVNMMSNVLLGSTGLDAYNLPWPSLDNKPGYSPGTFNSILILGIAFVLLLAGFATNIVRDKQLKTRSQLRVSGVTFNMYWGTTFLFDTCVFLVPSIICLIIVLAVQLPSLSSAGATICMILQFITFIPANILLTYCASFAFDKYETVIAVLPNLFLFSGMVPYIAVSLVDMIAGGNTAIIIHYVCCVLSPPYIIFGGFYFIDRLFTRAVFSGTSGQIVFEDYFKPDNHILFSIFMPLIHIVAFYLLLKLLDVKSNGGDMKDIFKFSNNDGPNKVVPDENPDIMEDEDKDVKAERDKVALLQKEGGHAVAYVSNLRKEFKKRGKTEYKGCKKIQKADKIKVAVRNATLSVHAGEVFGLLGPNGAGKTTLMNMIIAEVGASRGKVVLNGFDIHSNLSGAFQGLGYCPQHDALWEEITFKEHLELYAAIRGIPPSKIEKIINFYIESLKCQEHAKKHSKKCSGGTKRKLCYAMSMLASPEVVMLDEPSTGMDPESKRFLWDTISSSFESTEKGAILTTHYMEEADALCSRLAIMVNGKIECLGSSQHLKDKFGSGYLLEVKLKHHVDIENKMDELEAHFKTVFPNVVCSERFGDRGQYKIARDDVTSLSKAFSFLEQTKQTKDVEEYSFSQSTLEQVFLEFAKKQEEGSDDDENKQTIERQTSRTSNGSVPV